MRANRLRVHVILADYLVTTSTTIYRLRAIDNLLGKRVTTLSYAYEYLARRSFRKSRRHCRGVCRGTSVAPDGPLANGLFNLNSAGESFQFFTSVMQFHAYSGLAVVSTLCSTVRVLSLISYPITSCLGRNPSVCFYVSVGVLAVVRERSPRVVREECGGHESVT